MRPTVVATAIALALGAAGCEREPPDPGPAEEAAAEPVEVTGVRIVSGGRPGPFAPDDPLSAIVETRGAAESATLVAVWRDSEGRIVSESSRSITPSGAGSTEIPAVRPGGWPPGSHEVEVWLDGERAGSWPFTVGSRGPDGDPGEGEPRGG